MKLRPGAHAEMGDSRCRSADPTAEVDAAWQVEIARRAQQIDSGEVECIPWETVMAEMRAKYG